MAAASGDSSIDGLNYPIRKNAYSKLMDLALVNLNANGYTGNETDLAAGDLPAAVDKFPMQRNRDRYPEEVDMSHQNKTATLHHTGREKATRAKSTGAKKAAQGIPLIVVFWAFGLGLTGYVVSRFVFTPHPLHWASGAGGILLGAIIGYIWFFTRGDVGLI